MKAIITVISIGLFSSAQALAVDDPFKIRGNGSQIVIDLSHHAHVKKGYRNHRHQHKNKRYRHTSRHRVRDAYCDEHRVNHHHHQDYYHSHTPHNLASAQDYVPDYYLNEHQNNAVHCWAVKKESYWKGRKALIGGQMCRDSQGYTYVEPTSRYLIKYRGRYQR